MSYKVLVATDGAPQSAGAVRMARRLAERDGARVEVISVIEPVPIYDTGFMVALPETELFEARREVVEREVRIQMESVAGDAHGWPLHLESGVPTSRVVARADESGADLIIMGLGQHGSLDRLFGRETALQVVRLSHLPVLAVPERAETLPNDVVLAVDFSTFSSRAAEATRRVLKSPARLHLVHIVSGLEFVPGAGGEWHPEHIQLLEERLRNFAGELDLPEGWSVTTRILEGEPSREILAYAENVGADLIAAGSHGHSFVGRLLMGSVSTRIIRGARCAVLVVPPADVPREVSSPDVPPGEPHPWEEILQDFNQRNAGHRTELEIHHPRFGAQHSGRNFPLRGVVFDRRGDRIDILLGEQGSVDQHLSHSVPGPRALQIRRDDDGNDQALEVDLAEGHLVLRILRD